MIVSDGNWWGYSRTDQWVVVDRTLPINKPGKNEARTLYRCKDWSEFTVPFYSWGPPDYVFAPQYLGSLQESAREAESARLAAYQLEFPNIQRAREIAERDRQQALIQEWEDSEAQRISEIKSFVESRGIKALVHFTRVSNVPSILSSGLLPIDECWDNQIYPRLADGVRYDGHRDSICVSISFPNYKMFYRKQCDDPLAGWAILTISPDVLWENDCSFVPGNAASNEHKSRNRRDGVGDLVAMFSEISINAAGVSVRRDQLNIPLRYSTDPQAEVLIFGGIDRKKIIGIYVKDERSLIKVESEIKKAGSGIQASVLGKLFEPRKDHGFWPGKQQISKSDSSDA